MLKSISRKMKYFLVAVFAFVFSFTALVIGAPKAKAATSYADFSYDTKDNGSWTVSGEGYDFSKSEGEFGRCYVKLANISSSDTSEKTSYIKYSNSNGYKINKVSLSYPINHLSGQSMDIYVVCGSETTDTLTITTEMTSASGIKDFILKGNNNSDVYIYFILASSTSTRGPRLMQYSIEGGVEQFNTGYFVRIEYTASNTVTFDKNGGSGGSNSVTATPGSAMPSATMPTRTGYTFAGYYDSATGGTQYYTSTGASARNWDKTSDTILYAHWTANTYTVKYNGNKPSGASGNVTNISGNATWTYDSNATLGGAPTLAGYTFNGWYKEAACTNKVGNASQALTKPNLTSTKGDTVNLYAKWTANTYTVTLNKNDGTGVTNSVNATYDSAMPSATMPTRVGYNFLGYYDTNSSSGGTQYYTSAGASARSWNKTSNTTLYARWDLKAEIKNVIGKIDAIGGPTAVEYPASKGKIVEAESAYTSLIQEHLEYADVVILVEKHNELLQDRDKYDELRDNAIANTISLIEAIGEEVTYPSSKASIVAAEAAYNGLDSSDRSEITNHDTLTQARTEYDNQRDVKVAEVIAAINNIGEVTYPETQDLLANANTLYNALDSDEQNETSVTNLSVLNAANATYATLRENAVNHVIELIDAITTPFDLDNYLKQIGDAREAFDKLGSNDQNSTAVTNLQKLLDAEAASPLVAEIQNIGEVEDTDLFREKVSTARANYEALINDQKAMIPDDLLNYLIDLENIIDVMDAINNIGVVEYTPETKALINTANAAYAALDDDLKENVANYDKLVQANTDYDKVNESAIEINNIPEFEYTPEFKAIIDSARETYDALTPYQKSIMPEPIYQKLLDAEALYDTYDKINNIGEIKNTKESRKKVKKAKEAYDDLTDSQKDRVDYATLKTLDDDVAVYEVIDKVNNIPSGYTEKEKNAILDSKDALKALTDDQKGIMPKDVETLLKDKEVAYDTMVSINDVYTVQYSDEYKAKLENVRMEYDSLTDSQKDLVRNYIVLTSNENAYVKIDDLVKMIDSIEKVKYNKESKEAIEEARAAYKSLKEEYRELVPNIEKLEEAETKYQKAEHNHGVAMGWVTALSIIFGLALIFFIIFFIIILLKRRKDDEDDNKKKKQVRQQ